jgi:hypothetical protein
VNNSDGFRETDQEREPMEMTWTHDIRRILVIIVALVGGAASSCAAVTPTTKAVEVERLQCEGGQDAADDAALMQATTVLAIVPIYSQVHSATTGTESRISGVKLLMRPPEPFGADRTLRILQCHSARGVLGRLDPSRAFDDPYWLPGAWLGIDLVHEAGNFAVIVHAEDIHQNLQVLERAKAFASTHANRIRTDGGAAGKPQPGVPG